MPSEAMDFDRIAAQLDRVLARYSEWSRPLDDYIAANMPRVNKDRYTCAEYSRGLMQLREALAPSDPFPEFAELADELCSGYLNADSETRERVREFVSVWKGLAWLFEGYADHCAREIHVASDVRPLLHGLAAVSIANCEQDFRDTLITLAKLYVAAENAGINPQPHFEAVADLSATDKPAGGSGPMSETLRHFFSYAVLASYRGQNPWVFGDGAQVLPPLPNATTILDVCA